MSLAVFARNGTSTTVHICSPYYSILAPDRATLAVPISLAVHLNRVHCPKRFIPHPCRMAGRIQVVEYLVAFDVKLIYVRKIIQYFPRMIFFSHRYNIYLCNFVSQITSRITGSQKLHSEARAAQLLAARVHLPWYAQHGHKLIG